MHYFRRDLLQPRSTARTDEVPPGTWAVAAPSAPAHETDASSIAMAATLVPAAAAILDRETAAGVLAARDAPQAGPRSVQPPTDAPRQDGSHALLPLLEALIDAAADLIQVNAETARRSRALPPPQREGAISGFYGPGRVLRAGEVATIPLDMSGSASDIGAVVPQVGQLVSADGARLPADVVQPSALTPGAGGPTSGALQVRVPPDASPGRYEALLLVPGMPGFRGVVGLDIGP